MIKAQNKLCKTSVPHLKVIESKLKVMLSKNGLLYIFLIKRRDSKEKGNNM